MKIIENHSIMDCVDHHKYVDIPVKAVPFVLPYPCKHNQKERLSMKHKVTVVLSVVVIAVVSILSVQAYHHYKHQQNVKNAQVAATAAAQAKAKAQQQAKFNAEAQNLQALCKKDLANYDALPTAQKAKQQAPDCSLQFVQ